MEKSNQIAAIILGAAAALALYKFYQMSKEERASFFANIRETTQELLENSENTVEKVQHYVAQIKGKSPDAWIDKIFLVQKMLSDFYAKPSGNRIMPATAS